LLKSCSSAELLSSSDSKIKIRKILKKEKKFGLIIEFGGRGTNLGMEDLTTTVTNYKPTTAAVILLLKMHIMTIFVVLQSNSMQIAKNIKKLREEKTLMQKEVANAVGVHPSNYSKMEKGEREFGIEVIDKLAKYFGVSIDELVHMNGKMPKAVTVEDKTATEKIQLIAQLEEEDKHAVYRIIDGMLTKSKFQNFFEQNLQAAK